MVRLGNRSQNTPATATPSTAQECGTGWKNEKINQDYTQVDLFRIENGKVVEHWDTIEPVPENDVNGGKF